MYMTCWKTEIKASGILYYTTGHPFFLCGAAIGEFELNFPMYLTINISHNHSPHLTCYSNTQYRMYNLKNKSQVILAHC